MDVYIERSMSFNQESVWYNVRDFFDRYFLHIFVRDQHPLAVLDAPDFDDFDIAVDALKKIYVNR